MPPLTRSRKKAALKPLTSLYGVLCRLLTTIGEPYISAQQGKRGGGGGGGALSKNVITIYTKQFFGVLIKNGYFILFILVTFLVKCFISEFRMVQKVNIV